MTTVSTLRATKAQIKKLQNEVHAICQPTYFDHIPAVAIANAIEAAGFDASEMNGIYCGHEGRSTARFAENGFVTITWYRMGSGKFEVIAYVH